VLYPTVKLPEFHAKNLARLPPVDASHCDVSAILIELRALRTEVRNMGQIVATVDMLKAEVVELKSAVADCRKHINDVHSSYVHKDWPSASRQSSTAYIYEFPSVATSGCSHPPVATSEAPRSSEASTSGFQVKVKKTKEASNWHISKSAHNVGDYHTLCRCFCLKTASTNFS